MTKEFRPSRDLDVLLEIMDYLRSPAGCPWDRAQTNTSLVPHTLEEAYEVAEAVAQGEGYKICEELGDLLLQIVFHCQVASEQGLFDFGSVVQSITEKLIRRHPHIFGGEEARTPDEVSRLWAKVKKEEKGGQGRNSSPPPLPGLLLVEKMADKIEDDKVQDPLLRKLVDLVRQAVAEKRCLEAETRGYFAKPSQDRQEFGN
jgi:MazG family protein